MTDNTNNNKPHDILDEQNKKDINKERTSELKKMQDDHKVQEASKLLNSIFCQKK